MARAVISPVEQNCRAENLPENLITMRIIVVIMCNLTRVARSCFHTEVRILACRAQALLHFVATQHDSR